MPDSCAAPADDARRKSVLHALQMMDSASFRIANTLDLSELLTGSFSSDYTPHPALLSEPMGLVQLPSRLYMEYEKLECKCFMGLFPDVQRAWLTIDNKLFVWRYADDSDICCIDSLDQVITATALLRPKKGLFVESITPVLVVATTLEIVFFPISVAKDLSVFKAFQTSLTLPTDNVQMLCMVGTECGRVFAGGADGNLHEIVYRAEDGWLTRKCRRINLTSSPLTYFVPTFLRFSSDQSIVAIEISKDSMALFTLSDRNTIQLFSLGEGEGEIEHVSRLTVKAEDVQRLCTRALVVDSKSFSIISLHSIEPPISQIFSLMAITDTGIRLYFSTIDRSLRGSRGTKLPDQRYSTLDLVHVRLPPEPPIANGRPFGPVHAQTHCTFYSGGMSVAIGSTSDDTDTVTVSTINSEQLYSTQRTRGSEKHAAVQIRGKVWAVSEAQQTRFSNDLDRQVHEGPRRLLLLTSGGVTVIQLAQPIDTVARVISTANNPEATEVLRLIADNPRDILMSMVAQIAAFSDDSSLASKATAFATKHGREPQPVAAGSEGEFSALHNGLYILCSRIVSDLWKMDVAKMVSSVSIDKLKRTQSLLASLIHFLDSHRTLLDVAVPKTPQGIQSDRDSLSSLHDIAKRAVDALEFVAILMGEDKETIEKIDFETLVSTEAGERYAKQIFDEIILRAAAKKVKTEVLARYFQDRCPLFFGHSEFVYYKALEDLERLFDELQANDQRRLLTDILSLFDTVISSIDLSKAGKVFRTLVALGFSGEAARFCLKFALSLAPWAAAKAYYLAGDSAHAAQFCEMEHVYQQVTDLMNNDSTKIDEVLEAAALVDDELGHVLLFEWLLSRQLISNLLRFRSKHLERFLLTGARSGDVERAEILAQYYVDSQRFSQAAQMLSALAEDNSFEIPISKRAELLSFALTNARCSRDDDLAAETQDKLDIARVQVSLVEQLESSISSDQLRDLRHKLLPLSALFNDYAAKYRRYETALEILHIAEGADGIAIMQVWSRFVRQDGASWYAVFPEKFRKLHARLRGDRAVFQTPSLFTLFIGHEFAQERRSGFVSGFMADAGIPPREIGQIVLSMLRERVQPWDTNEGLRFLVQEFICAVQHGTKGGDASWIGPAATSVLQIARANSVVQFDAELARLCKL